MPRRRSDAQLRQLTMTSYRKDGTSTRCALAPKALWSAPAMPALYGAAISNALGTSPSPTWPAPCDLQDQQTKRRRDALSRRRRCGARRPCRRYGAAISYALGTSTAPTWPAHRDLQDQQTRRRLDALSRRRRCGARRPCRRYEAAISYALGTSPAPKRPARSPVSSKAAPGGGSNRSDTARVLVEVDWSGEGVGALGVFRSDPARGRVRAPCRWRPTRPARRPRTRDGGAACRWNAAGRQGPRMA